MIGWTTKPLGEIAIFERGLTYSKTDEVAHSRNGVLRANNIDLGTKALDLTEIRYIANAIQVPQAKKVRRNSLLICTASGSRSHLGKVALIDDDYDLAFGGFMGLITAGSSVDGRYLYYLLTCPAYQAKLDSLAGGTNINNLKFKDIADFAVPLPPLEEQRRIVAVLDEAFAAIATATANAEKNLANAESIFESCLETVFDDGGANWQERELGDVCRFVGGSQPPKAVFSTVENNSTVRLIQIRDYKSDRHRVFIPKNLAKRFCSADDVMIGRYGPPLFQILRGIDGAYNVALMKAAADPKLVSKDFLYFFMRNARLLRHVIAASDRAAGQIGLTKETLEPYPIKFPDLAEQEKVVGRLLKIEIETALLKRAAQAKLNALAELKKSLLHQAFAGGLLTTLPETIAA